MLLLSSASRRTIPRVVRGVRQRPPAKSRLNQVRGPDVALQGSTNNERPSNGCRDDSVMDTGIVVPSEPERACFYQRYSFTEKLSLYGHGRLFQKHIFKSKIMPLPVSVLWYNEICRALMALLTFGKVFPSISPVSRTISKCNFKYIHLLRAATSYDPALPLMIG